MGGLLALLILAAGCGGAPPSSLKIEPPRREPSNPPTAPQAPATPAVPPAAAPQAPAAPSSGGGPGQWTVRARETVGPYEVVTLEYASPYYVTLRGDRGPVPIKTCFVDVLALSSGGAPERGPFRMCRDELTPNKWFFLDEVPRNGDPRTISRYGPTMPPAGRVHADAVAAVRSAP